MGKYAQRSINTTEATKSIMSFCLFVYLFCGLFILQRCLFIWWLVSPPTKTTRYSLLNHFLAYTALNNAFITATRQVANVAIQHPASEVIQSSS